MKLKTNLRAGDPPEISDVPITGGIHIERPTAP